MSKIIIVKLEYSSRDRSGLGATMAHQLKVERSKPCGQLLSPGLLQLGDRGPWLAWGLGRNHRWFIPLPVSFHQSFMPVIFGGKHKFLFHLGFLPTWF